MRKKFRDLYHWKWPLYAGLTACVVYLPIILANGDNSELFYWLTALSVVLIASLAALVFLFTGGWKTALSLLSVGFVCIVVSFILWLDEHRIRTAGRWEFNSAEYKRQVLSQAGPAQGDYRHIEWDGWGWAGSDTVQYLVCDPQNRIIAKGGSAILIKGKACGVANVHRLEKAWYLVTFFTDTAWNNC